MPQFLLVFRQDGRPDRSELWDTTNGQPHINGTLLVDGATVVIRGVAWLATREDLDDGMIRFVCTLVVL